MPKPATPGWTLEHEAEMLRRWREGETANIIAVAFNAHFPIGEITRNTILGKIQRARLHGEDVARRPSPIHAKKERDPELVTVALETATAITPHESGVYLSQRPLASTGLSSSTGCRFIEGNDFIQRMRNGEDVFCNTKRKPGSSYCQKHDARCWRVAPMKMDEK